MAPSESPDNKVVQSGRLPWSFKELIAALDFANHLCRTPHDDWDRRPKGVTLDCGDGIPTRLTFNPDILDNQIGLWLSHRLREQGHDYTTRMSHVWRFFEVRDFMNENQAVLRQVGLIKDAPGECGAQLISESLLKVLAESPYQGIRLRTGERQPTFHLDRVIQAALRLDQGSTTTGQDDAD